MMRAPWDQHAIRQSWANRAARRYGFAARQIRWPLGYDAPFRRSRLDVERSAALGDVLLCTPALRRLKELNPSCHLTFYTDYPVLVDGLSFIDRVRPTKEAPENVIRMGYEASLPPRRHIAKVMGDHLGVNVTDVRPSCVIDPAIASMVVARLHSCPKPRIVVNRSSGAWTPNKNWPSDYWEQLIQLLLEWSTVIEIGTMPVPPRAQSANYVSLVGVQSLPELVSTLAGSDMHVGPVSGPVHIAAAFAVPSVVIYGGYEHPICSSYPGNVNLYSKVECSPCWLREPCPYGKKCLHLIQPRQVDHELQRLWKARKSSPTSNSTFQTATNG